MSVEKHAEILLKLGDVVIEQADNLLELKNNNDSYQISKSREVSAKVNENLKRATEEYNAHLETLEINERHDILHFKQMKIINILVNGTDKIMQINDLNYAGLDRILDNMRIEITKLQRSD